MPEHTPAPTHARSLYGFFMYLFSSTALCTYCIWAFTPDFCLHYFNFYYYPQKYWATVIPIQCLVALTLFTFLIYPSSNLIMTADIDSPYTINDPFTHYNNIVQLKSFYKLSDTCICPNLGQCKKNDVLDTSISKEDQVPQLYDLNIRFVCKKLYLNK